MVFTLFVAGLWSLIRTVHASELPIIAFAVTGYSSVLMWRNIPSRLVHAIEPNAALLYHRYVRVIDIYVARSLLEIGGVAVSFFGLVLVFFVIGWLPLPEDPLLVLLGLSLLAWFGFALGTCIGALSEQSVLVEKIWHPLSYVMFPLSGAAFLVDGLPTAVQPIVLLFPMVHGVEILRQGYFGSVFVAHYSLPFMLSANLLLTLLGLANLKRVSAGIHTG
jgi:ABC-type polysaccharide/polyol phosphate export permease